MITVLLLWVFILFIFSMIGFLIYKLINRIIPSGSSEIIAGTDEVFFMGFLSISTVLGFLSLLIPVGNLILYVLCLIAIITLIIYFRELKTRFRIIIISLSNLSLFDIVI